MSAWCYDSRYKNSITRSSLVTVTSGREERVFNIVVVPISPSNENDLYTYTTLIYWQINDVQQERDWIKASRETALASSHDCTDWPDTVTTSHWQMPGLPLRSSLQQVNLARLGLLEGGGSTLSGTDGQGSTAGGRTWHSHFAGEKQDWTGLVLCSVECTPVHPVQPSAPSYEAVQRGAAMARH